jgi:uroporphyrinogen decarboxylase
MTNMTSCERLLTALRCQEPDRVPFLESTVDEAVALALLGVPAPDDLVAGELGTGTEPALIGHLLGSPRYDERALIRHLGLDAIGMYCFARHGGIQMQVDGHYMVAGGSIKSRADLARVVAAEGDLHLPDPDNPAMYEPFRRFLAETRDTGLARYCFFNLASDPVILGMGLDTFALALYDDRSLVEGLFEIYSSWYARVARRLCELGFDFLWCGDDIAFKTAPYVSPRVFRQLFMPHYRRVADQITLPWIFHSDGNLMPILDDLLSLGMNGLHPIEPGPMDLGLLKRRYGEHLCLVGHISVDTLSRGTPEEVDALVKQAIETAGPGGGYIAGSSNSIAYFCKAANVRAMQRAIFRYGRYPMHAGRLSWS